MDFNAYRNHRSTYSPEVFFICAVICTYVRVYVYIYVYTYVYVHLCILRYTSVCLLLHVYRLAQASTHASGAIDMLI